MFGHAQTVLQPAPLRGVRNVHQLPSVCGFIECEQPHPDLYRFYGRLELAAPPLAAVPAVPAVSDAQPSLASGPQGPQGQRTSVDSITARFGRPEDDDGLEEALSAPLSADNLLLKGSRLRNTDHIYGAPFEGLLSPLSCD